MRSAIVNRILFWSLLAAAVAGAVFWTFHFPYRFERLVRAIPASAEAVTRHDDLAGRWRELLRGPLAEAVIVAGGRVPEDVLAEVQEAEVDRVMRMLGRRPLLAAYVPALGVYGRPAVVLAAWAGGHTQLLRWGFLDAALHEFTPVTLWKKHRLWRRPCPEIGPRYTLTLAGFEGVVVGVLSEDVTAIAQVVTRLDWASTPVSPLAERLAPDESAAPDRGIWLPRGAADAGAASPVRVVLDRLDAAGVVGSVYAEAPDFRPAAPPHGGQLAALPALLGDMPDAVIVGSLGALAEARRRVPELAVVTDCLAPATAGLPADTGLFFAVSGDQNGGRLMNMRVPALWCGVRLPEQAEARTAVLPILDTINARWKLGLVAVPVGAADGLQVLTPATDTLYGKLPREERAAYAVRDGWLIACSSLEALQRRLGAAPGAAPVWANGLSAGAPVSLWMDCARTGGLVRGAVAGYTLFTLYTGFAGGKPVPRIDTEALKHGIAAFQRLGTVDVRVADGGDMRIDFGIARQGGAGD